MKPELTPPQSMLLVKICERPCYVSDYYPPAGRLIKWGYAEFRGNILHPTEAGKVLAKARDGGRPQKGDL